MRLMHLKLFLQEGPKHLADEFLGIQNVWNQEITDEHIVFKSFLVTIVGSDFQTKRKTLQTILDQCSDWQQQSWKTVLLLLRMLIDTEQCKHLNREQLNDFKKIIKSLQLFFKNSFRICTYL